MEIIGKIYERGVLENGGWVGYDGPHLYGNKKLGQVSGLLIVDPI